MRANAQCMRKFYLLQAAAAIEAIMLCSVGANYGTVLLYGAWPGVGDGCGRHGDSEQRCAMRHLQHYDRGIDNNVLYGCIARTKDRTVCRFEKSNSEI